MDTVTVDYNDVALEVSGFYGKVEQDDGRHFLHDPERPDRLYTQGVLGR